MRICNSQFKCNYLIIEKQFLNILLHFWNLRNILIILKKKIMLIANVFPKLQTVKNFVRPLSKIRCFGTCFDSQHVKVSRTLAKSQWEHFYHVFSSFLGKLIWKMSPLVLGKILEVFVNTLTAEAKYSIEDLENLQLPIQIQLYDNWKNFSQFFCSIYRI